MRRLPLRLGAAGVYCDRRNHGEKRGVAGHLEAELHQ